MTPILDLRPYRGGAAFEMELAGVHAPVESSNVRQCPTGVVVDVHDAVERDARVLKNVHPSGPR